MKQTTGHEGERRESSEITQETTDKDLESRWPRVRVKDIFRLVLRIYAKRLIQ